MSSYVWRRDTNKYWCAWSTICILGSCDRALLFRAYQQVFGQFPGEILKMSIEYRKPLQIGQQGVSRYLRPAICYLSIKWVIVVSYNRVTCRYSKFPRNESTPTPTLKTTAIQCSLVRCIYMYVQQRTHEVKLDQCGHSNQSYMFNSRGSKALFACTVHLQWAVTTWAVVAA
jgi:hypothetical protein